MSSLHHSAVIGRASPNLYPHRVSSYFLFILTVKTRPHFLTDDMSSGARGFHPHALTEPYLSLSFHNAPSSICVEDAVWIRLELRTRSRSFLSSVSLSVIQYGEPALSLRACTSACWIQ